MADCVPLNFVEFTANAPVRLCLVSPAAGLASHTRFATATALHAPGWRTRLPKQTIAPPQWGHKAANDESDSDSDSKS